MNERRNLSTMTSEILHKAESIPELTRDDERDIAFRTYNLLCNIKNYMLAPVYLGMIFALTVSFIVSALTIGLHGPNDPTLIYIAAGSFIASFVAMTAFLKTKYYNPCMKAAISGFKFAMEKDAKMKLVIKLIMTHDSETIRPINKYLLS